MIELIIGVVAGVIVGWHFPQPAWATSAIDKVKSLIGK